MAGVQPAVLSGTYSAKAQAAALIMSAQYDLSHYPDARWKCITAAGQQGARSSNLDLDSYGRDSIDRYMADYRVPEVGHRFWVLNPFTRRMGTGDTAYLRDLWIKGGCCKRTTALCTSTIACSSRVYWAGSNALWVVGTATDFASRPATREAFVAWPPPGYVPYQFVYDSWTFAYPGANFFGASVTMVRNNRRLPIETSFAAGYYGDQTFVWRLRGDFPNGRFMATPPMRDSPVYVTIRNVKVAGRLRAFSYTVRIFDPAK